jgi:hypothetical protein
LLRDGRVALLCARLDEHLVRGRADLDLPRLPGPVFEPDDRARGRAIVRGRGCDAGERRLGGREFRFELADACL